MSKYIFSRDDGFGTKIVYETTTDELDVLLTDFQYFLRGCAFNFRGDLVIDSNYDDENWENDENQEKSKKVFDWTVKSMISSGTNQKCKICGISYKDMVNVKCFDPNCENIFSRQTNAN